MKEREEESAGADGGGKAAVNNIQAPTRRWDRLHHRLREAAQRALNRKCLLGVPYEHGAETSEKDEDETANMWSCQWVTFLATHASSLHFDLIFSLELPRQSGKQ